MVMARRRSQRRWVDGGLGGVEWWRRWSMTSNGVDGGLVASMASIGLSVWRRMVSSNGSGLVYSTQRALTWNPSFPWMKHAVAAVWPATSVTRVVSSGIWTKSSAVVPLWTPIGALHCRVPKEEQRGS